MMEKTISAKTSDFQQDEETNLPKVMDGQKVIIGGMITDKTIKYTKNNKVIGIPHSGGSGRNSGGSCVPQRL